MHEADGFRPRFETHSVLPDSDADTSVLLQEGDGLVRIQLTLTPPLRTETAPRTRPENRQPDTAHAWIQPDGACAEDGSRSAGGRSRSQPWPGGCGRRRRDSGRCLGSRRRTCRSTSRRSANYQLNSHPAAGQARSAATPAVMPMQPERLRSDPHNTGSRSSRFSRSRSSHDS